MEEKKFSRREWLMTVFIALVIEYFIISWSHEYKNQDSLISYISFAATIASLFLAVVAIIYGFFQGESSSRASSSLMAQLEKLGATSNTFSRATKEIDNQLERIVAVADRLGTLERSMEVANTKIETVGVGIKEVKADIALALREKGSPSSIKVGNTSTVDLSKLGRQILRQSTFDADMMAYALAKYANSGQILSMNEFCSKFYMKTLGSTAENKGFDSFAIGYTLLAVLRSVGLVSYTSPKEDFQISDELKKNLNTFAEEVRNLTAARVKAGIAAIDTVE